MIGFGGTETYVLTVVAELERLGHDVIVFAPETGPAADFARDHGVRVLERESQLPSTSDAVLAQDAATAYLMARRYPGAVRVFVSHSTFYPLQSPPQLEGTCDAIVAMNDRVAGRIEELGWSAPVVRLR